MVDQSIVTTVRQYLNELPVYGIHPSGAILFGSCARGENRRDSDIDILVLAPEFDAMTCRKFVNSMWLATSVDYRIEPIACGSLEWSRDNDSRPIVAIARSEGVAISV